MTQRNGAKARSGQISKRAFIVTGPESSGTRLMTWLFIRAGCFGDADHDQRLDDMVIMDLVEPLIVWRRSVPHRGAWPDLTGMARDLRIAGYEVNVVIMSRDWHSMAISQEGQHVKDASAALYNIRFAYGHIFQSLIDMGLSGTPYELVNLEALIMRPEGTARHLFTRFGLPAPELPVIFDANARYYKEPERVP